jgi:hypothetical protein
MYALTSLQADGFVPDAVVVHAGWGESLPIRAIFPKSRIIVYCEYYYGIQNRDVAFDPEFLTLALMAMSRCISRMPRRCLR